MPTVDAPVVAPDTQELERLWAREPNVPPRLPAPPKATLTLTRDSALDFADRQILVWVDGEACGNIRYGKELVRELEPGRHDVRVFNTLFKRTIAFHAAPGEHVRLRCGNGMPTAGWLMMVFLHVTYLKVWIERVQ